MAVFALASPVRADPCEAPLPGRGAVFEGSVPYIGDGDSLCVDIGAGAGSGGADWIEVRIADFNAPELNEPRGREARAWLARVVSGRRLRCRASHRSWDRIVATCVLLDGPDAGRSVGDVLREQGAPEGGR